MGNMGTSASKGRTRRTLRILLFGAGTSACAFAQFSSLSTPGDGSVLFFATPLAEKNTAEPAYGKIFQFDSSGLHLLYSRDIANQDQPCSSAYDLTALRAASEGSVWAVVGQCSCLDGNAADVYNCVKIDRYTSTVVTEGQSRDYPGEFWLSRNGKLALNRRGAYIIRPLRWICDRPRYRPDPGLIRQRGRLIQPLHSAGQYRLGNGTTGGRQRNGGSHQRRGPVDPGWRNHPAGPAPIRSGPLR
ncbi:exported hypothetical protein [Candidatus Sulfopaludibacter sp. SbA4]|nr:exported hypothetical protein [Candidatus Sulfopaludibacter sp. SbA4]